MAGNAEQRGNSKSHGDIGTGRAIFVPCEAERADGQHQRQGHQREQQLVTPRKQNGERRHREIEYPAQDRKIHFGHEHDELHQRERHWCIAGKIGPWTGSIVKAFGRQDRSTTGHGNEPAQQAKVAIGGGQHRKAPRETAPRRQHQKPQPAPPNRKAEKRGHEHREIKQQCGQIAGPQTCHPGCGKTSNQTHQRGRWSVPH